MSGTYILKEQFLQRRVIAQIPADSKKSSVPDPIRVQANVRYLVVPASIRVQEPEQLLTARVTEVIVSEDELRNRSAREDLLDNFLCTYIQSQHTTVSNLALYS